MIDDAGARPPVLLLHGFTQTPASWTTVIERLAPDWSARAVAMPFHGGPRVGSFEEGCELVLGAEQLAILVGYSMGARLALGAAIASPERVAALVLLGCNPGFTSDDERTARAAEDDELAARIESIGTSAFLDEWLARPMFAGLDDTARDGRDAHLAADLAAALRVLGTGRQPDWWEAIPRLPMPILAMAGGDDVAFVERARRIAALAGERGAVRLVPHAGHAAHLEQPDVFTGLLREWLADLPTS